MESQTLNIKNVVNMANTIASCNYNTKLSNADKISILETLLAKSTKLPLLRFYSGYTHLDITSRSKYTLKTLNTFVNDIMVEFSARDNSTHFLTYLKDRLNKLDTDMAILSKTADYSKNELQSIGFIIVHDNVDKVLGVSVPLIYLNQLPASIRFTTTDSKIATSTDELVIKDGYILFGSIPNNHAVCSGNLIDFYNSLEV